MLKCPAKVSTLLIDMNSLSRNGNSDNGDFGGDQRLDLRDDELLVLAEPGVDQHRGVGLLQQVAVRHRVAARAGGVRTDPAVELVGVLQRVQLAFGKRRDSPGKAAAFGGFPGACFASKRTLRRHDRGPWRIVQHGETALTASPRERPCIPAMQPLRSRGANRFPIGSIAAALRDSGATLRDSYDTSQKQMRLRRDAHQLVTVDGTERISVSANSTTGQPNRNWRAPCRAHTQLCDLSA